MRDREAAVTGRWEAAASCRRRSLAADMHHYNIRVNGALRTPLLMSTRDSHLLSAVENSGKP
jgi:hypothetical protein